MTAISVVARLPCRRKQHKQDQHKSQKWSAYVSKAKKLRDANLKCEDGENDNKQTTLAYLGVHGPRLLTPTAYKEGMSDPAKLSH